MSLRSPTPQCGKLQGPDLLISGGRGSISSPREEQAGSSGSSGQHSEYLPASKAAGPVPPAPRPNARRRGNPKRSIAAKSAQEQAAAQSRSHASDAFSLPSSPHGSRATVRKPTLASTIEAGSPSRKRLTGEALAPTMFKKRVTARLQPSPEAVGDSGSSPQSLPKSRGTRSSPRFSSSPDSASLPELKAGNSQEVSEIVQFSGRADGTSDTGHTSPVAERNKADTPSKPNARSSPHASSEDARLPLMTVAGLGGNPVEASSVPASGHSSVAPLPRIMPATDRNPSSPEQTPSPKKPRVVFTITSPPDTLQKHGHTVPHGFSIPSLSPEPAMQQPSVSGQAHRPAVISIPSSSPSLSLGLSPRKVQPRSPAYRASMLEQREPRPERPSLHARKPPRRMQGSTRPTRHSFNSTSSPREPQASPVAQGDRLEETRVGSASDAVGNTSAYQRNVLEIISTILESTVDDLNQKEAALGLVTEDFEQMEHAIDKICSVHQQEQNDLLSMYQQQCFNVERNLSSAHKELEESLPPSGFIDLQAIIDEARGRTNETRRLLAELGYQT